MEALKLKLFDVVLGKLTVKDFYSEVKKHAKYTYSMLKNCTTIECKTKLLFGE